MVECFVSKKTDVFTTDVFTIYNCVVLTLFSLNVHQQEWMSGCSCLSAARWCCRGPWCQCRASLASLTSGISRPPLWECQRSSPWQRWRHRQLAGRPTDRMYLQIFIEVPSPLVVMSYRRWWCCGHWWPAHWGQTQCDTQLPLTGNWSQTQTSRLSGLLDSPKHIEKLWVNKKFNSLALIHLLSSLTARKTTFVESSLYFFLSKQNFYLKSKFPSNSQQPIYIA